MHNNKNLFFRYTVTSPHTTIDDISRDWVIIRAITEEVLSGLDSHKARVPLKGKRYSR